jgi:hypothetical protein
MDENCRQSRATGMAAMWLPWLVAPLFVAAPIGGCAVAGRWRPAVACAVVEGQSAADVSPPAGPAGAVVAVERR